MEKELRSIIRSARFSEPEWRKVRESAEAFDVGPSTYLRLRALDRVPRPRRRRGLGTGRSGVAYQLARIGVNLNQLTRLANSGLALPEGEIQRLLEEIRGVLRGGLAR